MKDLFTSYEQALELKKLGFNEPCLGFYYDKNFVTILYRLDKEVINAPLKQQAFKWFRDNYSDLDFGVGKIYNGTNNYHYHINLQWEYFEGSYEEAENALIDKLIVIIKNSNK